MPKSRVPCEALDPPPVQIPAGRSAAHHHSGTHCGKPPSPTSKPISIAGCVCFRHHRTWEQPRVEVRHRYNRRQVRSDSNSGGSTSDAGSSLEDKLRGAMAAFRHSWASMAHFPCYWGSREGFKGVQRQDVRLFAVRLVLEQEPLLRDRRESPW